jgi:glucokinase
MQLFAGIEIGGTKLQLVTGDETGRIIERRKLAVDVKQEAQGIRKQIEVTLPELLAKGQPRAVGVGFGGPVDWKTGKIYRSHQIEGWADFELSAWLQPLAAAPIFVDNDANVAALGEARHGAGVGLNPAFYVTIGSGIGGGLIVNGNLYHGASPGEAEIGHIRLDRNGTTVESRCSGWAVDARIRELAKKDPTSGLAQKLNGNSGGEAKFLAAALQEGDALAKRILDETAEDLAFGLSHVVHLFHPAIIVIGGGLSGVGEPFRLAVQNGLRRFVMGAFGPGPIIKLSELEEDAVPVGALELAQVRMASLSH